MVVRQILNRIYSNEMEQCVEFYEKLLGKKCKMRLKHAQYNLELAQVGGILIICGSEDALKPFKDTKATFLVDSIASLKEFLLKNGAVIIKDIQETPTGKNMIVKHFDGTVIEYVEL